MENKELITDVEFKKRFIVTVASREIREGQAVAIDRELGTIYAYTPGPFADAIAERVKNFTPTNETNLNKAGWEKRFEADTVAHPAHYNTGKIEVIEFLEDQKLGYHVGNTVKYICRAGRKDPTKEIEDLKKAAWYLARKIELLTSEKDNREVFRPNEMGEKVKETK